MKKLKYFICKNRKGLSNIIKLFFACIISSSSFAQTHPQNYFISPLTTPLIVSGNFGEPRENHFHTGLDFTTRGQTKLKVLATADGYVSRIKVSAVGYGKAIYITHPNGYMTVYGHLDHFAANIQEYVRKNQYAKESFEVELYPEKNLFPVKQGEVIAYSGNSGGSTAPHLHYEIRDASGESFPLNPFAFGLNVPDKIAPKIQSIAFYPLDLCCDLREPVFYKVHHIGSKNFITPDTIISSYSKFSFGVQASDWMNSSDSDGDFGIYSLEMQLDGKSFYSFQFNRLDFAEGRYTNCLIDYAEKKTRSKQFYRTFLLPGNQAGIFKNISDKGIIRLNDSDVHEISVTVKDFFGNEATLRFHVKYREPKNPAPAPAVKYQKLFERSKENTYSTDSVRVHFPANILYDDFYFNLTTEASPVKNTFSKIYSIGDPLTPLHNSFTVSILPKKIPEQLKSKAIIAQKKKNGTLSGKTSRWDGNYITTQSKEMGKFLVMIDTTAPKIEAVNVKQNQVVAASAISFRITDNLSGVTKYNGYLDGKWALMEYDAKNNLLTYTVEKTLSKGEHSLKVIVEDEVKNKSSYTLKFKL